MSFKRKMKKAFKNIIGDFSGVQWRDLDHKKVYAAIVVAVLVFALLVAAVIGILKKSGKTFSATVDPLPS